MVLIADTLMRVIASWLGTHVMSQTTTFPSTLSTYEKLHGNTKSLTKPEAAEKPRDLQSFIVFLIRFASLQIFFATLENLPSLQSYFKRVDSTEGSLNEPIPLRLFEGLA